MKKRVIPLLLALALLMLTFVPAATAAGITKYVYTRNGSAISVENYTTDYTWAVIRYNGQTAYVMTQYLVDGSPVTPVTPTPSGGSSQGLIYSLENELRSYHVVSPYTVVAKPVRATGWVNLRYIPSTECCHAENLYANTQLTVIAETANWLQVRKNDNGVTGYVMRQYTISMGVGSSY